MHNFSKQGKWRLPGKPEKEFYGELKFNDIEGANLVLSDSLDTLSDFPHYDNEFILLGNLIEDTPETSETKVSVLVDHLDRREEKYDNNRYILNISLNLKYIFFGTHLESKQVEFDKVILSFSNIDQWIYPPQDLNRVRFEEFYDPEHRVFKGQTLYCSPNMKINNDCRIQISSIPETPKQGLKPLRENNIKFIIESVPDKSLEKYFDLKNSLLNFLNFVVDKEVVLHSFEGLKKEGSKSTPIKIVFHSMIREKMDKVQIKTPFLFRYAEVKDKLENILNKWFWITTENKVVMDLYFGVMYNTESYLSNNFIMLFTALEVYHRYFMDKYSVKKKEKIFYVNSLFSKLERCDLSIKEKEKLTEWTKDKEQLTSKERVEEIYDTFASILPYLSKKIESRSQFVNKIVRYRNDLSHGNLHFEKIDNEDLFWQCKNLQLILQLCILSKIGFEIEEIKKLYLVDKLKELKQ